MYCCPNVGYGCAVVRFCVKVLFREVQKASPRSREQAQASTFGARHQSPLKPLEANRAHSVTPVGRIPLRVKKKEAQIGTWWEYVFGKL